MKEGNVFCEIRPAAYEELPKEKMLFVRHRLKTEKQQTI